MLARGPDALLAVAAEGAVRQCNALANGFGWVEGAPFRVAFLPEERPVLDGLVRHGFLGVNDRMWTLVDGRRVHITACAGDDGEHLVAVRQIDRLQGLSTLDLDRVKTQALAEVAGSLARELNDPVSIVQGRLELLVELSPFGRADDGKLSVALDHARRVSATLQNLRLVGQAPLSLLQRVPVAQSVERALDLVAPGSRRQQVTVAVAEDVVCGGEPAAFVRIIANVLQHLIDLVGRQRPLRVTADPTRGALSIRIFSSGGPDGELLDLTTSGLQMSVTLALARSIGCTLSIRRGPSGASALLVAQHAPDKPGRARPIEQRVLAVGCERFRSLVASVLDGEGYAVVHVSDGEAALDRLEEDPTLDAVLAAMVLPGMSGLTLARAVKARHPRFAGRFGVVADGSVDPIDDAATIVHPPLSRGPVLAALGRHTRRRVAQPPVVR